MNIIGLIVEYNPFHNGHLYQINKIKELYPDSLIICVTSTCFSQRGDISILNKWQKTEISLENNIDIVLELPYFFSSQSSDTFAHAALQILNEFKIDTLVFGTESNDLKHLHGIASLQVNNKCFDKELKKFIDEGYNYPTSVSLVLNKYGLNKVNTPNDLLAVSYLKEIIKNNYNIKPISILRTNDYHDKKLNLPIVSASNIREKYYKNIDVNLYVPNITKKYLDGNKINDLIYFNLLKYKIITDKNLNNYLDVTEGIENKIKKEIFNSNNLDELILNIKSKRYTYNKIMRMLCHILIGLEKTDVSSTKNIEYLKILGFNSNGRKYINFIKNEFKYPLIYNYNKKYLTSYCELISTKIYSLIINDTSLIENEYKKNIIIK